MKSNDIFPGKYLKAADLGTAEPVVTIDRVVMETLGDESKAVVYFRGKERGVVLNKTNWNAIVDITGKEDSDDWAGARIKLYVTKVEYAGKRVPAIRIDTPTVAKKKPVQLRHDEDDQMPDPDHLIEDEDKEPLPF